MRWRHRFILLKNRTPALPKKSGEKVTGRLGVILPPDANPVLMAFLQLRTTGHTGATAAFHGAGGVHGCHPVAGRATQGFKTRNRGSHDLRLALTEKTGGLLPRGLLTLPIQQPSLMPGTASRRRVLGVPFCLVHVFPRRLARGCVPRRRGAGAAPGCSRRCWSAGRCRWADPGIV